MPTSYRNQIFAVYWPLLFIRIALWFKIVIFLFAELSNRMAEPVRPAWRPGEPWIAPVKPCGPQSSTLVALSPSPKGKNSARFDSFITAGRKRISLEER